MRKTPQVLKFYNPWFRGGQKQNSCRHSETQKFMGLSHCKQAHVLIIAPTNLCSSPYVVYRDFMEESSAAGLRRIVDSHWKEFEASPGR